MFSFNNYITIENLVLLLISINYYFLTKKYSLKIKFFLLFSFLMLSLLLKYFINLDVVRDYYTYTRVLSDNGHKKITFINFVYEPYLLLISKILLRFLSIPVVLKIYYNTLFVISIAFFSWLAFLRDLSPWRKYLLFNLFFVLFTFILIRNGIAYMLIALFLYDLSKGRNSYIYYGSVLFHITCIPIVIASFFRNKKINIYIIPIGIVLIVFFAFLFLGKSSILYAKFNDFKKNSITYNHLFHEIIFYSTLVIFSVYFLFNKNKLNNYFYILLIIMYLILFNFNYVMGFRFSFYIFIYLLMSANINFTSKIEEIINKYHILFLPIALISLKLFLYV